MGPLRMKQPGPSSQLRKHIYTPNLILISWGLYYHFPHLERRKLKHRMVTCPTSHSGGARPADLLFKTTCIITTKRENSIAESVKTELYLQKQMATLQGV